MNIVLSADDLASFSPATRNEILRRFSDLMGSLPVSDVAPAPAWGDWYAGHSTRHLEDITQKHIERWMEKLSPSVAQGVRIIAERGPVFDAHWLSDADINLKQFQSAVTKRTRGITGDRDAKLLLWAASDSDPYGTYAVSPITHQSMRWFFGLPI